MTGVMQYLSHPAFWIAVIIVAVIVNWGWNYFTKRGKLV